MTRLTPYLNHKLFELMTMNGVTFSRLLKVWTDEEHLQFHYDTLDYYEFVVAFLTENNGSMARALDTDPRRIEHFRHTIETEKEFIQNDESYRKVRAFCRQKEAKEKAEKATEPLSDDVFTMGSDLKSEAILSVKYN